MCGNRWPVIMDRTAAAMATCVASDDEVALLAPSSQRGHQDDQTSDGPNNPFPQGNPSAVDFLQLRPSDPNMPPIEAALGRVVHQTCTPVGSHFHWKPMTALHSSDRQTLADHRLHLVTNPVTGFAGERDEICSPRTMPGSGLGG